VISGAGVGGASPEGAGGVVDVAGVSPDRSDGLDPPCSQRAVAKSRTETAIAVRKSVGPVPQVSGPTAAGVQGRVDARPLEPPSGRDPSDAHPFAGAFADGAYRIEPVTSGLQS
jgi:hypothetical protein